MNDFCINLLILFSAGKVFRASQEPRAKERGGASQGSIRSSHRQTEGERDYGFVGRTCVISD